VIARLQSTSLNAAAELDVFLQDRQDEGAVASFVGIARRRSSSGRQVERLFLDHYAGMTERSIEQIAEAGAARFEVSNVLVVHRCGEIVPGEAIVFVAAASRHRADAFACVDYLMDRLKTEAAFWKREDGPGASSWIEPTDLDRERRARWSD
jgi:molybdopterin synthase catalytic subunit